jgi:hypothetical protein
MDRFNDISSGAVSVEFLGASWCMSFDAFAPYVCAELCVLDHASFAIYGLLFALELCKW